MPEIEALRTFENASVLVTGGSHGIGLATARAFQRAGAKVVITGRRVAVADYETDLDGFEYRQLESVDDEAVTRLGASFERLDVLINNAGESAPGGADQWRPENFERALKVNIASAFRLSNACLPALRKSTAPGGAAIVGLASLTSFFGFPLTPGYGAAKAGLVALTKTMAAQWGRYGIRVNAVAAGTIQTNMGGQSTQLNPPGWQRAFFARTPLQRMGQPEDVADPILFLCSEAARYITGATLLVDGGYSATAWEISDMDEIMALVTGPME